MIFCLSLSSYIVHTGKSQQGGGPCGDLGRGGLLQQPGVCCMNVSSGLTYIDFRSVLIDLVIKGIEDLFIPGPICYRRS